nr:hypothetical protein [Tanacetum cinerariifolium]
LEECATWDGAIAHGKVGLGYLVLFRYCPVFGIFAHLSTILTYYIPGPEEPQTPPVPQDKDEREPMFIQPHDPNYVPEPMYPEYIPLKDEHVLLAEEQPLPPIDSPTAESSGYVTESDPKEDPEEDDADDEDEDEEEEEHLALANFAIVIPTAELVSPPEGT